MTAREEALNDMRKAALELWGRRWSVAIYCRNVC